MNIRKLCMSGMETKLSRKTLHTIRSAGIFAYKVSDRFQTGVPDIYIQGGNWIENKWVRCVRAFSPAATLRPEQKVWASNLIKAGDSWWYNAHIVFESDGKYLNRGRYFICGYDRIFNYIDIDDFTKEFTLPFISTIV